MQTLRFQGRPGSFLLEHGERHGHGDTFETSDERAAQLLADPTVPVVIDSDDLTQLKRGELNDLARRTGVENPEALSNKEQVIEAIEQIADPPAPPEPDPATDAGNEGPQPDPQEDH